MQYIHVLDMSYYDLYVLSRFYHLKYMNTDAWWPKPDADQLQYVPWVTQESDPIAKLVESTFLWGSLQVLAVTVRYFYGIKDSVASAIL